MNLNQHNEHLRKALLSIASNTCCPPCQEAAMVAARALWRYRCIHCAALNVIVDQCGCAQSATRAGNISDGDRWRHFASSPQTALMLGTSLDPNSEQNWRDECNKLADSAMGKGALD